MSTGYIKTIITLQYTPIVNNRSYTVDGKYKKDTITAIIAEYDSVPRMVVSGPVGESFHAGYGVYTGNKMRVLIPYHAVAQIEYEYL